MLNPAGQFDVSVSSALFEQRLAASPLTGEQRQALLDTYHQLTKDTKGTKVTKQSGVPQMYTMLQSGAQDPQPFADLLDSHPNDMPPMLQEIVQAPGYGLAFANRVAHAAGIMDAIVVAADGTVHFAPPAAAS
jgi:hypothetical protein